MNLDIVKNPIWIAGFMTGEGYFYKQKTIKDYKAFTIGLCMHIESKPILEVLQSIYGGTLYLKTKGKHCQWRIGRTKQILKFVNDVSPYLACAKKHQFEIWFKEFNDYKNGLDSWKSGWKNIKKSRLKHNPI